MMLRWTKAAKRVMGIVAAILAARKLAQYDGGKREPSTVAELSDGIRWAVEIMREIDEQFPVRDARESGGAMNLEQLSTMTEAELQAKANEHLEQHNRFASNMEKDHHATQAQIFVAELERRKQAQERIEGEKVAARDYKLELWVIGLIGAELLLALVGIIVGWVEGSKQMDVLAKLNTSGAETATTLTTLQKEQEAALETQRHTLENLVAMNDALQDEIDLNLTESIQYSGGMTGNGHEEADFANSGRTVMSLWGSKFGSEAATMRKQPAVLTPASSIRFDITRFVENAKKVTGAAMQVSIPFELYLKRQNGTKYVAKGTIQVNRGNNVTYIGPMTTTRTQW